MGAAGPDEIHHMVVCHVIGQAEREVPRFEMLDDGAPPVEVDCSVDVAKTPARSEHLRHLAEAAVVHGENEASNQLADLELVFEGGDTTFE